jgi:hypothetical protein
MNQTSTKTPKAIILGISAYIVKMVKRFASPRNTKSNIIFIIDSPSMGGAAF